MDDELGAALRDHFRQAADDIQPDAALLHRLRETATPSPSPSRRVVSLARRHPAEAGTGADGAFPHTEAADRVGDKSGRGIPRRRWWLAAAAAGVAAAVVFVALVFVLRPGTVEKKTHPANQVVPASSPSGQAPAPMPTTPGEPGSSVKPTPPDSTPRPQTGTGGVPGTAPTGRPSTPPTTTRPNGPPPHASRPPNAPTPSRGNPHPPATSSPRTP
ncbi:hypothetical protein AB0J52_33835 [Spirillospora sp. NPDC049652]